MSRLHKHGVWIAIFGMLTLLCSWTDCGVFAEESPMPKNNEAIED